MNKERDNTMKWEGTVEGDRHNKEIWKVIRELSNEGELTDTTGHLLMEIKAWLSDLDKRIARIGVAGKLPPLFVELMMQDYADAANSRAVRENISSKGAFDRIRRMCEAWDIDHEAMLAKYERNTE